MVCVPMAHRGRVVGCVGLEAVRREMDWGDDSVTLLRMVSEIFANALEHNRAQEALRKSEVRFRTVFEGAPIGMRVGDWADRVSWSNPALERMLGFTNDELLRLSLADYAYPEDALHDLRLYREMLEGARDQYQIEKRFVRKDGRTIWGRVTGAIARDGAGKPAVSLVMVEDITEQKRAQEALQQSHQTLERRVEERTYELATLNAVAGVVSRSIDLGEIMGDALEKTMSVAGLETGAAYRLDEAGQTLELIAHRGLSAAFLERVARLPLELALAGRSFSAEQPLVWRVAADYPAGEMKDFLLREGLQVVMGIPLFAKGRLAGALAISTRAARMPSAEESSLLLAIGRQIGIAVENARLREQAETAAAVNERSRLARELHDSVTQSLYSLTLYSEAAARLVAAGKPADAASHLRDVRDTAREALREMRLLIFELRPPELEKAGLAGALQARLDAVETRGGIQARLDVEGAAQAGRLPIAAQTELYYIAREALNNTLKHARARSVRVQLRCDGATASLDISDDGAGFALEQAQDGGGMGLAGMRERAQRIGGRLRIDSAPGAGTRIRVEIPAGGAGRLGETP
jgi:PAS domain S-box-containing protein